MVTLCQGAELIFENTVQLFCHPFICGFLIAFLTSGNRKFKLQMFFMQKKLYGISQLFYNCLAKLGFNETTLKTNSGPGNDLEKLLSGQQDRNMTTFII